MKNIIGLALLIAGSYSFSASALFTHCQISYSVGEFAVGGELGLGGTGTAKCHDHTGNKVNIPLNVQMIGGGLKFGVCTATGQIKALGAGFEVSELLSAVAKVELGNDGQNTVGGGAKATPFGVNGGVLYSTTNYSPGCITIGDAEVLVMTEASGRH